MSNRWEAFHEDNDEEIYITNNPIRKIKKKLRKKKERYKKNPSPEIYNEISKLENLLEKFTTSSKPKPKKKKKKFKKIKVNKAEIAAGKRRKQNKERLDRYNSNYKEEKRRFEKEQANFERINKLKQLQTHIYIPKDIKSWLSEPTKKGYYMLMKKYHPDKNNNNDNEYVKIITSQWDNVKKII
jgi:hypothetical protein